MSRTTLERRIRVLQTLLSFVPVGKEFRETLNVDFCGFSVSVTVVSLNVSLGLIGDLRVYPFSIDSKRVKNVSFFDRVPETGQ